MPVDVLEPNFYYNYSQCQLNFSIYGSGLEGGPVLLPDDSKDRRTLWLDRYDAQITSRSLVVFSSE